MNFPKFPVRQTYATTQDAVEHNTGRLPWVATATRRWRSPDGGTQGSHRACDTLTHEPRTCRCFVWAAQHADIQLWWIQWWGCVCIRWWGFDDGKTTNQQHSHELFLSTVVEKVSSLTGHKRLLYLQITQELALSLVVHLSWWKWVICFAFSSYGCTQLYYSYISKLHLKAESHSMCVVVGMVYTPVVYVYWWYLCLLLFMFTHFTCALNMSLFSALSQLVVMFQIVFGKQKTVISLYQCTLWVCLRLNTTVFVSESLLSNGAR